MEFPVICIFLLFVFCYVSNGCDITKECSNDKDVKWATDRKECHVFHNKCFLENVNCHHRNNKVKPLEEVSKEECQRLCITQCSKDDNPVCGYFNDEKHTFANQCEMEAHICMSGETSLFAYGIGPCG